MSPAGQLIYTFLPVVFAGVCNMIFVKRPFLDSFRTPMDGGAVCADGKRVFGDNKTWKGFAGMIFFTSFWMGVFGLLADRVSWASSLSLIPFHDFSVNEELFYGALWGLGYVLFELPNSYMKRRIDIPPGKNRQGMIGIVCTFIDQADSVLGCLLFMLLFYIPTPIDALALFLVGVVVHYSVNIALFFVGLKKQAG